MTRTDRPNLGIMYRREFAPEALPDFARRAEALGFDELWVVEDCLYTSGIAAAATALASTRRISVGLGIMPAVVRNPVFAAMEIATLARLHPGRFLPGFGHGVADWMRQVGAFPASQLTALEEVTVTVRALLAGERVTYRGQYVEIEAAELVHPPDPVPPVSLGVIGPRSLALSGRVADGTILSEFASPAYVAWAKAQIARGRQQVDHQRPHRLTVFAFASAAASTVAARERARPLVADAVASTSEMAAKLAPLGILSDVNELVAKVGRAGLAEAIPERWIDRLTIAGTPEDWAASIGQFDDLGVDSVVLVPLPGDAIGTLDVFSRHLKDAALVGEP